MIIDAILKINPNAKVTVHQRSLSDYDLIWHDNTTPISKADIEAQLPAVEFDMAMEDLRAKRNAKLAETDYLALSDNTMSAEMQTYRTSLRDITDGVTTVEQIDAITWPTKPGA